MTRLHKKARDDESGRGAAHLKTTTRETTTMTAEKKSVFDAIFPKREYTSSGWVEKDAHRASVYGVTLNTDKPTTGVIGNNEIVQFISDETCGDAIDLGWETAIAEFEAEHGREPDDDEKDEWGEVSGDYLIGDWKKVDGLWEPDKTGSQGFSALVRETVTQVLWSKTTTRANHCSPCYPGQVDIGSDGDFLAFTLPADCFDSESGA